MPGAAPAERARLAERLIRPPASECLHTTCCPGGDHLRPVSLPVGGANFDHPDRGDLLSGSEAAVTLLVGD